jgi:ribosomal protein RSM22 (predicted rRNA methylase)
LPATYAAGAAVFAEAVRLAPDFAPKRLLDAGAGPGGASWAAVDAWPGLSEITLLDASAPFLRLARRLADAASGPLRAATSKSGDLLALGALASADVVVASYALAEIPEARQGEVVDRLWAASEGLLALVEPGTPAGFTRIRAARARLIAAGARVLAPCPHDLDCPITGTDWCHFSQRLPRSRDHRLAKGAEVNFEDEKYAYVVAARPQVPLLDRTPRVLAPPRVGKPGIDVKLCVVGRIELRHASRRDKAAHAVARRLSWGDAL